ncbi:hypothetical protein DFH06DRAFT_133875 [Mycena polygramma]|nr:hypothetical protein DFH06DRAFT_133875 [Mycena polygramma]
MATLDRQEDRGAGEPQLEQGHERKCQEREQEQPRSPGTTAATRTGYKGKALRSWPQLPPEVIRCVCPHLLSFPAIFPVIFCAFLRSVGLRGALFRPLALASPGIRVGADEDEVYRVAPHCASPCLAALSPPIFARAVAIAYGGGGSGTLHPAYHLSLHSLYLSFTRRWPMVHRALVLRWFRCLSESWIMSGALAFLRIFSCFLPFWMVLHRALACCNASHASRGRGRCQCQRRLLRVDSSILGVCNRVARR